jgi:hypothetical protein
MCWTKSIGVISIAVAMIATVATVGQTRWRLPVTIEAVQDVSTRSVETGGQARGVLYVGRGNAFTIKKGEHFLMVKIAAEGGCRVEYEKRQYNVSSCPWLDGFRDHQEDFFKVVTGRASAPERASAVGRRSSTARILPRRWIEDPRDPVWSWFVFRGPHGETFSWGRKHGHRDVDLLRQFIHDREASSPGFLASARAVGLKAITLPDTVMIRIRTAIQVFCDSLCGRHG